MIFLGVSGKYFNVKMHKYIKLRARTCIIMEHPKCIYQTIQCRVVPFKFTLVDYFLLEQCI